MKVPLFLYLLFLLSVGLLLLSFASASEQVLLENGFDDDEGWITNSPSFYFLDNASGRFHYDIEGGTGSYASYSLGEPLSAPFTLEFDVSPVLTEEGATFRLGIGTEERDSQSGPLVLFEMSQRANEKLFYLTAISKESLKSTILSSPGKSPYGGGTVRFEDGKTYHIKITWYPAEKRVSVIVTDPTSGNLLFTYFVQVSGKLEDFTDIFITAIGDGVPGPHAVGYIDNLKLTLLTDLPYGTSSPTPSPTTPEPTPTLVESVSITPEPELMDVMPERTLLPPPPTPSSTQKSGLFPLVSIISLVCGIIILKRR